MSVAAQPFDVLLIYAASDRNVAHRVQQELNRAGFRVLDPNENGVLDAKFDDQLRKAVEDADAVVAVASPNVQNSPYFFFEIGAATAWEKPIFVVRSEVSQRELPVSLQRFPSQPLSKIKEVVRALEECRESPTWNDERRAILVQLYAELGVPVDQLAMRYSLLSQLTRKFKQRAKINATPEDVMQQLMSQRKKSRLPRISSSRPTPAVGRR
jgi:hypothetical protein